MRIFRYREFEQTLFQVINESRDEEAVSEEAPASGELTELVESHGKKGHPRAGDLVSKRVSPTMDFERKNKGKAFAPGHREEIREEVLRKEMIARDFVKSGFNLAGTARKYKTTPHTVKKTFEEMHKYVKYFLGKAHLDEKTVITMLLHNSIRTDNDMVRDSGLRRILKYLERLRDLQNGEDTRKTVDELKLEVLQIQQDLNSLDDKES